MRNSGRFWTVLLSSLRVKSSGASAASPWASYAIRCHLSGRSSIAYLRWFGEREGRQAIGSAAPNGEADVRAESRTSSQELSSWIGASNLARQRRCESDAPNANTWECWPLGLLKTDPPTLEKLRCIHHGHLRSWTGRRGPLQGPLVRPPWTSLDRPYVSRVVQGALESPESLRMVRGLWPRRTPRLRRARAANRRPH